MARVKPLPLLLVVVVLAFVGSVAFPGLQSWHILRHLRTATNLADVRENIRELEISGLVINAVLSIVAVIATCMVVALTRREARARGELERVMESRSRLLRGFSHDVKNPLGAADGFLELLTIGAYGPLSDQMRPIIERISHTIARALGLITDLHELARAESGNLVVHIGPVDVGSLVRLLVEQDQAAAQAKGLSLRANIDPALPTVQSDGDRLRQVLSNLLSNAIKYTSSGGVTVRAGRHEDGASWAMIEVADTGPGIPEDKREAIFSEFTRLQPEGPAGSGVGLAISKSIADALRCRITVKSEIGEGSTFTLWIPADVKPVRTHQHSVARRRPADGLADQMVARRSTTLARQAARPHAGTTGGIDHGHHHRPWRITSAMPFGDEIVHRLLECVLRRVPRIERGRERRLQVRRRSVRSEQ